MSNERILAMGRSVSNDTWETGLNNNDMVIGGSGAGKTGGYVIPNILQRYGSMIITDTKGNLWRKYAAELEKDGYIVKVLDFVNPRNSTFAYNPLDYVKWCPRSKKRSEKDIITLARALAPPISTKDPFWDESARTVLSCLIGYTLEALPREEQTLMSVARLFGALACDETQKIFNEWEICHPDSFAAKKYRMFKSVLNTPVTWGCIRQFVAQALDLFDFEEANAIYEQPISARRACRIEDIGRRRTALFLNVSDTDRTFDKLINVFYTQALQVLCNTADKAPDNRLAVPVRFILDDFATNVYIPDFDKIVSVIRSRNISVSLILQSLTQLETMYTHPQASTIINNCDHLLYLGGQDLETAEYIGTRAGKTPDSILNMPLSKAYLIEKGKKAELVDKIRPYSMTPGAEERNGPCQSPHEMI